MTWKPIDSAPKDKTIILGLCFDYGYPDVFPMYWAPDLLDGEAAWIDASQPLRFEVSVCEDVRFWVECPDLPAGIHFEAEKDFIPPRPKLRAVK